MRPAPQLAACACRSLSVGLGLKKQRGVESPTSLHCPPCAHVPRSRVSPQDGDSAGQSNIFAVEPKVYLQGSERDSCVARRSAPTAPLTRCASPESAVSNTYVTGGVALVLALGLLVARFGAPPDYSYENPRNLSDYAAAFKAEA